MLATHLSLAPAPRSHDSPAYQFERTRQPSRCDEPSPGERTPRVTLRGSQAPASMPYEKPLSTDSSPIRAIIFRPASTHRDRRHAALRRAHVSTIGEFPVPLERP